jgi:hypothetical protein
MLIKRRKTKEASGRSCEARLAEITCPSQGYSINGGGLR